jgi:hypothetical protein
MLATKDLYVDEGDDIVIREDILIDDDVFNCTMRTAERRLVARGEDFILDDIAAAIEQFIHKKKDSFTKEGLRRAIDLSLLTNNLFSTSDYRVIIPDTMDRAFHIVLKFTNPLIADKSTFKIVVDIENQRVYRGY